MKIKTHTRTTHTLQVDDETTVDLLFEPYYEGDIMVERVGTKLIVAYLVHDDDGHGSNPLDNHAAGNIYQRVERRDVLHEPGQVYDELGLDSENSPNIDRDFFLDGERTSLRGLAEAELASQESDDPERDAETLAYELYTVHWKAIAGPYVVPLSYCSSNHGPGTMTVSPTTWDGDPDDLPDGVWVAGRDEIENIGDGMAEGVTVGQIKGDDGLYTPEYELLAKGVRVSRGTLGECLAYMKANYPMGEAAIRRSAVEYASSICSEYQEWCNGNVFGCVCEIFQNAADEDPEMPGPWVKVDDRDGEYWGFIGHDYAKETLKTEFFDPAVKKAKEAL